MAEFEKIVWVSPAFDNRSDDHNKNKGIGSCRICFILKGPLGAVQFMIGTDWYLPEVQREHRSWQHDFDTRFNKIKPDGWDVGYHSPVPMYDGQEPMADGADCEILGAPCYYDGDGLQADEWVPEFLAGGTNWLWPKLEERYRDQFESDR